MVNSKAKQRQIRAHSVPQYCSSSSFPSLQTAEGSMGLSSVLAEWPFWGLEGEGEGRTAVAPLFPGL